MLDIKFIRDNLDTVRLAMADLQALDAPVDRALALDDERRQILLELETLRARRNTDSKRIGQLLREGQHAEAEALKAELGALPEHIKELEERLRQVEPALHDALLRIPNLPLPSVPVGKDDSENVVVSIVGEPRRILPLTKNVGVEVTWNFCAARERRRRRARRAPPVPN